MCKRNSLMGTCYIAQGTQLDALWRPRGVGWEGGREVQEGRIQADSVCCTAEMNTSLSSNSTPIRKNDRQKERSASPVVSGRTLPVWHNPFWTLIFPLWAAVTQSRLKWSASAGCWRRQYSLRITVAEGGTGTQACWVVLGFHIPGSSNHFTTLN